MIKPVTHGNLNNKPSQFCGRIYSPYSAYSQYTRSIERFPLLTVEEEIACARKIQANAHDADKYLNKLVNSNLRFVVSIVKNFKQHRNYSFLELTQEGNMGLMQAAKAFNPDKFADGDKTPKFSSYAVHKIKAKVQEYIYKNFGVAHVERQHQIDFNKVQSARNYLHQNLERKPTMAEIAEHLEMDKKDVEELMYVKKANGCSIDEQLNSDGFTLEDTLIGGNAATIESMTDKKSLVRILSNAFISMDEKTRNVMFSRFGFNGNEAKPLTQVAREEGLTRMKMRVLESKFLEKIEKSYGNKLIEYT